MLIYIVQVLPLRLFLKIIHVTAPPLWWVLLLCVSLVFNQMLPLLTYAGLLVVPVGAIVFTEHFIFPRIGFTRYWAMFRNLTHSTPAVASWSLGLVFGFGLNALDVMSFYYLFIPTWFFTSVVYIVLAPDYVHDYSKMTKVLRFVSVSSLVITLGLALNTMFMSVGIPAYEINRELFFNVGFICTIIYFASAYWVMQRSKQVAVQA